MLSDQEIDDLENYIVNSTLQDLPGLLMRAIPLLLAELRLARAALVNQANDFFTNGMEGNIDVRNQPGSAGSIDGDAQLGGVVLVSEAVVPMDTEGQSQDVDRQERGESKPSKQIDRPHPGRNRRKGRRGTPVVE